MLRISDRVAAADADQRAVLQGLRIDTDALDTC